MNAKQWIYFTSGGAIVADYTPELEEYIIEQMKDLNGVMSINGNLIVKTNITYTEVIKYEEADK